MVHLIRVIGETSSRKQPGKYRIMPCCVFDNLIYLLVSSKRQDATRMASDGPEQDNLSAYL